MSSEVLEAGRIDCNKCETKFAWEDTFHLCVRVHPFCVPGNLKLADSLQQVRDKVCLGRYISLRVRVHPFCVPGQQITLLE